MRRLLTASITLIALVLGASIQATAEPSAEDAMKYRRSIMKALGGHAGAISMQTRGLAGDPAHVAKHARAMAGLIAELHTIFQTNSNVGESEALSAIWEEPEAFAEALANAENAAMGLNDAADDGDIETIGRAFRNLGKACKGCHDSFRKEHDH